QRCPTHPRTSLSHFQSPTSFPPPGPLRLFRTKTRYFTPPRRRADSVSFLTLVTQSPSGTQKLQNTPLSNQKRPFYRHPKKNLQAHCSITLANVNFSTKGKADPVILRPPSPSARCCLWPRHRPNR
ncbi:hypothetical protein CSPX01_01713, partial [Colletotrichum filicis]